MHYCKNVQLLKQKIKHTQNISHLKVVNCIFCYEEINTVFFWNSYMTVPL